MRSEHLLLDTLQYALDEAADGLTQTIDVVVRRDGSVEVADDGRGTDTRKDDCGVLHVKPVMGTRDLRFFDLDDPPILADGLPRRGLSTVTALSVWLVHENRRLDGSGFRTSYGPEGLSAAPERLEAAPSSGTSVRFRPRPDLVDVSALEGLAGGRRGELVGLVESAAAGSSAHVTVRYEPAD